MSGMIKSKVVQAVYLEGEIENLLMNRGSQFQPVLMNILAILPHKIGSPRIEIGSLTELPTGVEYVEEYKILWTEMPVPMDLVGGSNRLR